MQVRNFFMDPETTKLYESNLDRIRNPVLKLKVLTQNMSHLVAGLSEDVHLVLECPALVGEALEVSHLFLRLGQLGHQVLHLLF